MLSNLGGALASMRQANERLEASKAMLNQHVLLALIKNILGFYDCLDPAQCKRSYCCSQIPADPKVRSMPQSRACFCLEGGFQ